MPRRRWPPGAATPTRALIFVHHVSARPSSPAKGQPPDGGQNGPGTRGGQGSGAWRPVPDEDALVGVGVDLGVDAEDHPGVKPGASVKNGEPTPVVEGV